MPSIASSAKHGFVPMLQSLPGKTWAYYLRNNKRVWFTCNAIVRSILESTTNSSTSLYFKFGGSFPSYLKKVSQKKSQNNSLANWPGLSRLRQQSTKTRTRKGPCLMSFHTLTTRVSLQARGWPRLKQLGRQKENLRKLLPLEEINFKAFLDK